MQTPTRRVCCKREEGCTFNICRFMNEQGQPRLHKIPVIVRDMISLEQKVSASISTNGQVRVREPSTLVAHLGRLMMDESG